MNTRSLILLQPENKQAWVIRPLRHTRYKVLGFGYEWFIHKLAACTRARLLRTKTG
jgi:hypothetical protein